MLHAVSLLLMGNTVMTELVVPFKYRGSSKVVQGWGMSWEVVTSLGSGNVWYVVPQDVGPSVLAVTDMLKPVVPKPRHVVAAHQRMSLRWSQNMVVLQYLVIRWSLLWCLDPWVRLLLPKLRVPLASRLPGFGAHSSGTVPLSGPPSWCRCLFS